jgi:hypothetical protein
MLCTIVFALLGPVLGTISTLAYVNLTSATPLELSEWFALDMWWVYVIAGVVGYMLGVLPAALSGLAFGAVLTRYRLGRSQSAFAGAAIGAVMLLTVTSITANSLPSGESLVIVLALGAISGSLCGLASHLIATGANNSFKPKPLRGSA